MFGWLHHPEATRKQLHRQVLSSGIDISVQGLDQRFTASAVAFLQAMVAEALTQVVNAETSRIVLPQFEGVYVTDCTQVAWGAERLKLGTRWDIQGGRLQLSLNAPTVHDQKVGVIDSTLPAGALHLGDLGFFKLDRFRTWNAAGVYWLSRYKVGTRVASSDGTPLDLPAFLASQSTSFRLPVQLSQRQPVAAVLVAAPLDDETYAKRLAHLKDGARKKQRPLSAAQLALARWSLYLTNIPNLAFEQAHILARTRWQIELLFKRWKSQAHLVRSRSHDPFRQRCEGYAKLLAILVAHWTLFVTAWPQVDLSLQDAFHLIQEHAPTFLHALATSAALLPLFLHLARCAARLPRLPKRKRTPLAFQLWDAFDLSP